jgi:hypothetical protein
MCVPFNFQPDSINVVSGTNGIRTGAYFTLVNGTNGIRTRAYFTWANLQNLIYLLKICPVSHPVYDI